MRVIATARPAAAVDPELIAAARLDGDASLAAFRVLAHAASRPGRIQRIADERLRSLPAVALAPLTLLDLDSTCCVVGASPQDRDRSARTPLAETVAAIVPAATGATLVDDPGSADMVVAIDTLTPALVDSLRRGSAEQPEAGARLVVAADALTGVLDDAADDGTIDQPHVLIDASGPGVDGRVRVAVQGVDLAGLRAIAAIDEFPAGIDTWIVSDDGDVVALPRTTRFTVEEVD